MDINYLAGLFDGEGYVYIFRKERGKHVGYYLSTGITMCHRPTLEAIHKQFGGHLNGNRAELKNPNHRTQFIWGAANKVAADFLQQIRPYIIIKADEIDMGLKLQQHIDSVGYPTKEQREGVRNYREDLFQKCKELKTKTFEPLKLKGWRGSKPPPELT
jgi:hypothetical protein